jgi:hypothetical protein
MSEPEERWVNVWRDRVDGHLWYGGSEKTRKISKDNARALMLWAGSEYRLVYRLHVIAHRAMPTAVEGKEFPITSRMIKSYPRTF